MNIVEKTKDDECCCSCKHNKRKKNGDYVYCECEIDKHYIGHIQAFDVKCEKWEVEE